MLCSVLCALCALTFWPSTNLEIHVAPRPVGVRVASVVTGAPGRRPYHSSGLTGSAAPAGLLIDLGLLSRHHN